MKNEKQLNLEQMRAMIKRMRTELEELDKTLKEGELNEDDKWDFPEDNYTVLAIWLLYDPKARRLFAVNEKKSWAELAEKLTRYVGWAVDAHILRQNFTRKNLKNTKKAQNAL